MNSSFFRILVAAVIGFFMLFKKFRFQQDNKEIESSSLSLPSPSPSISPNWIHHVFPSFHGPDVRKAFLSHLLKSFTNNGIKPFIDNAIERSKSIGPELIEAIRRSRIAIVLLSENYASSSWCLDELEEIMNCREVLGQIVITIFYDVPPTDIRKQTGKFGKAFKKSCKGKTEEHIERWRKALEDVAGIAGMDSGVWDNEAVMIENITTEVLDKLRNVTPPRDFKDLVGMRAHMEEMKPLLCFDLDEVRMIGIWGPPGIGKTTIARFLFHQFSSRFQLGAIMVNIKVSYPRPCLDEVSANVQLQHQMLCQMISQKDVMVSNVELALNRLKDKKVLLVLDDVDRIEQLDALAKETGWFGPGSRIIITTEDLRVLKAHRIDHIYKVKYPSSEEAFQIFCMNAFGKEYPEDGFYELAREVTYLAGELPLGLKVLGSALKGMSKQEWRRTLPMLKTRLDGKIESIIKFSYDALSDEEKDLFLYIACFFKSYSNHQVEELLAKKFSDVRQSLHILVEKSFIFVNQFESIVMHTLLQQFGRETSRKQYVHGIAKRRLFVDARDICDDTIDHKRLIGIRLKFNEHNDDDDDDEELSISEKAVETMSDVQFVSIGHKSERLHSLLHHSQKIRSLRWWNFQGICVPSTFNTESLIELDMYRSKLQKLWAGTKPLKSLKRMHLDSSEDLTELPDLSTATNLKSLVLRDCIHLVELPIIGNAIEVLDLHNCSSLMKLPSSINATNLTSLDLTNCSRLVELPTLENATNLQNLSLSNCSRVVELPAMKNTTNLKILNLHDCSSLVELPPSIGTATNITTLNISGCSSLVKLPSSIGNITKLREFNLSDCSSLVELPSSIGDMANLREFVLRNCSNLLELPNSIGTATNITELNISGCSSLVKLPSSIGNITNLREFNLSDCSSLVELPSSIGDIMANLRKFVLRNCSNLLELPHSIGTATNITELNISGCSSLVKLPSSIGNITNLREFNLSGCSSLVELSSSIGDMANLRKFVLRNCSNLLELPHSIGTATNITELNISGCSSLVKLPSSIGNITNLREFNLSDCSSLVELPSSIGDIMANLRKFVLRNCSNLLELPHSIGTATNITELNISGCSSLVKLPSSIGNITNLREFNLSGCSSLVELSSSIGDMANLRKFVLRNCSNLLELPHSIGTATNITELNISGCSSLVKLPSSIGNITNLREFNLSDCSSLVELPSSIGDIMANLRKFVLHNCSNLLELPHSIGTATNIETLDITGCSSLVKVPSSIGNITNLRRFNLSDCSSLVELPSSIGDMANLREFVLRNCSNLLELPHSIGTATKIQTLCITGCSSLVKVPSSIGNITNLRWFNLSGCSSLVELPSSIGNLQQLTDLILCGCLNLEALPTNIDLKSLNTLDLKNCTQLNRFPEISTKIKYLVLEGTAIKEIPLSIMSWSSLSDVHMSYFGSLKISGHALDIITHLVFESADVHDIASFVKGMSHLSVLKLHDCNNLVSLPQLCDSLTRIDADNCKSLERLDCSFNNPNILLFFTNCFKLNQEARDLIMHTPTHRYAVLPGKHVPTCLNYRATAGGSLTIKLNETSLPTSLRFKACITLVKGKEKIRDDDKSLTFVDIFVVKKGWIKFFEKAITGHIYTFEVGESKVTSSELVFKFNTRGNKWKIGECGILQILEVPSF